MYGGSVARWFSRAARLVFACGAFSEVYEATSEIFLYPQKIRFFHVGEYGRKCRHHVDLEFFDCEYGCRVGRPHYHACLFNCGFDDLEIHSYNQYGEPYFTSSTLASIWKYGFVDVSELNYATASYGARYCLKKIGGLHADDHYAMVDDYGVMYWLQPEYATMSRRPGIGYDWFKKYKNDVFPRGEVYCPGKEPVRKVPRYYDELYKESNPLGFEEVKAARLKHLRENADEYSIERLEDKYKVKRAQIRSLKRVL